MADKTDPFWPPAFRSAFHGEGAAHYSSIEAKRQYARTLIRLSEKLFWFPMAAVMASAFTTGSFSIATAWIVALVSFGGATYSRHYALKIYDALPSRAPSPRAKKKTIKALSPPEIDIAK